jgi:hypothetical protein
MVIVDRGSRIVMKPSSLNMSSRVEGRVIIHPQESAELEILYSIVTRNLGQCTDPSYSRTEFANYGVQEKKNEIKKRAEPLVCTSIFLHTKSPNLLCNNNYNYYYLIKCNTSMVIVA